MFITSLYELARFNPAHFHMHRPRHPWRPRADPGKRKVLMCHDIPAGILEEKYTQGLYPFGRRKEFRIEETQYRFLNWQNIDIFIFFGHYTVTIPPPSWIEIAHKHGVKILGTLIFEQWDDQKGIGREAKVMMDGQIVAQLDLTERKDAPDKNKFYALQLVRIAKHFGFEGYLMNFEVVMESPVALFQWLEFLRSELHKAIPGAELMWYDSVLFTDGSLQWQSMLNAENFKFFLACDSFFTDYHWGLKHLQATMETYQKEIAPKNTPERSLSSYDIYYGNDCYGRGTYAGGKYNTFEAVNEIIKYPFSVAVFG